MSAPSRAGGPAPSKPLAAPFPWFGRKSAIAQVVWERFGNPLNYVEPFAGSLAVLLARPDAHNWWERFETVNDADGYLSNFFRSVAAEPDALARACVWPVNETDLTARHLWLVRNRENLTARLMNDPDDYDLKAAAWWAWGACSWLAGDWVTGAGPYKGLDPEPGAKGVYRKIPLISGDHGGKGVNRPRPVGPQPPALRGPAAVIDSQQDAVAVELWELANRLQRVRVACGDFKRVLGRPAQSPGSHVTGVFLDPPYDPTERRTDLYGVGDRGGQTGEAVDHPAARARDWALANGPDPKYRIAYCGYTGPDDPLFTDAGWTPHRWSTSGGYARTGADANRSRTNAAREVVWFSPHCLDPDQGALSLFDPDGPLPSGDR